MRNLEFPTLGPCAHCGQSSEVALFQDDKSFCCRGCLAVYQLLHSQSLSKYYELRDQCTIPVSAQKINFSYVDMPEFQKKFVYGSANQYIDIHVGGVQCAACLWLLEKLPKYVSGIMESRLNIGTQILRVERNPFSPLRPVFEQIEAWGYVPQAIEGFNDQIRLSEIDFKKDLFRIGVAAFGAGNVMLMSVGLYSGVEGPIKTFLEYASLFLTIPVLGYSAFPLFKASFFQLKNRRISVDFPISIAVVTAFAVSIYGVKNNSDVYFDSITALVFLILSSRFIFKRLQIRHLSERASGLSLDIPFARKLIDGKECRVMPEDIRKGDHILVSEFETVPVDGQVILGFGFLNQSLLTGESTPIEISRRKTVFMGSQLITGQLEILATQDFQASRIPQLLREIELKGSKPKSMLLTEKVGQFFLIGVFIGVVGILAWKLPVDPSDAIYRALSLIIVACPCTFASVVPLVLTLSLSNLRKRGIFIRNSAVFEKIKQVKNIYFDKTGTLTEGRFEVLEWKWLVLEDLALTGKIFGAVSKDDHPVSKAISAYILDHFGAQIITDKIQRTVIPSRGIEVRLESGDIVRVYKTQAKHHNNKLAPNSVCVEINRLAVAIVNLGDAVRSESPFVIRQLKELGYRVSMLSGDQESAVTFVGDLVEIPPAYRYSNLTIDQKADILKRSNASIMIGDGNNDALAIQSATIGISVSGGVETALKSSDVYLANRNLQSLVTFLKTAKKTNHLINQALAVSVMYNLLAGTLAILGIIHPLLAALVMPANALTSLGLAFYTLRKEI